jgi:hypothetical protein
MKGYRQELKFLLQEQESLCVLNAFEKEKAHDKDHKEGDMIHLFCIKEPNQWKVFEVNAIPHNENWYYDKRTQPQDEAVPKQYQGFLNMFDKMKSEQFPLNKEWDYEIQLKE